METKAEKPNIIGTSVRRVDGVDKVTGQARYVGDIVVPGMVEGKFLRSSYPHARIVSIETRAAEKTPGVIAVLTRDDLTDIDPYLGTGERKDHPIIALERVLYVGQPVAAVAAENELAVDEALTKIQVEYEELPNVITIEEALAENAPLVHPFAARNICFQDKLEKGEISKGFAEADEIFEDTFEFPMVYHYSMEPHTTIARVGTEGITVWSSNSHPFGVRREVAKIFKCPLSSVRVIIPFVGGAYGSKSGSKIEPIVVALARKAGRPVRVIQNVSEAMVTVRRHSAICNLRTGVKKRRDFGGERGGDLFNTGAFSEMGAAVTGRALIRILGPYRIPHLKVTGTCVYTNTVSAASFRSVAGPQTAWATESQMDIIAQKLGLDPVEFRKKNLLNKGEELEPKGKPLDADLFVGLKLVTEKLGWDGAVTKEGKGRGFAFGTTDPGAPLASTATVHVLSDGSVVLLCGTVELGQGLQDGHEPDCR